MMTGNDGQRWIQHYNSSQKILLVGEGDFSFSACLARAFSSGANMVATCQHSKEMQIERHWSSKAHLEELERLGCLVLHEVDVYNMNMHPTLKHMKFDVIIFNFPHAGHFDWLCERNKELIQMHKELLEAYFKSAKDMVCEGGEVHVTHRDDYPYQKWKLKQLARRAAGLHLKEKAVFLKEQYPGYHNKRGGDINSNKTFPLKCCFTFKFILDQSENSTKILQKNDNNIDDDEPTDQRAASDIINTLARLAKLFM